MELSLMFGLVGTVALAAGILLYRTIAMPRLRATRLKPFRQALTAATQQHPVRSRCAEQDQVLGALKGLEDVDRLAVAAEKDARKVQIPTPPVAASSASSEAQLSSLVSFLQDPRVGLAVAGGEQLVANLFAMAVPGAAKKLGEAAMHGFWNGAVESLTSPSPEDLFALGAYAVKAAMVEGGVKELAHAVAEHMLHGAMEGAGLEVLEHADHAFELDGVDGAHFPVVTAVLSSYREIRLLREEKTSIERAVGHVVLDTGATGLGGFAGAKAGAAIGTLIAPGAGTAVGVLVGTVVGSVSGRMLANKVKEQPLKEAVAAYSAATQSAEVTVTASGQTMLTAVQRQSIEVQEHYQNTLRSPPRLASLEASEGLITRTQELRFALEEHLQALSVEREATLQRAQNLIPSASGFARLLGLDVRVEAMQALSATREVFDREQCIPAPSALPSFAATRVNPLTACRMLAATDWPDAYVLRSRFRPVAEALLETRGQLLHSVGAWVGRTARSYRGAVARITECLEHEADRHLTVIAGERDMLITRRDAVEKQRAALGR